MIRYIVTIGDPVTHRYSSAIRSPLNPEINSYPDSMGALTQYPVRLIVPKINNKLSDSISGSTILGQQTIEILNTDGTLDNVEGLGWFNTPLELYRTDKENPIIEDFDIIFSGIINYPVVSQELVRLSVDNVYRSLTEEVTNTFNIIDYPSLPDKTIDKDIPIGYGDLKNVPLFEVDTNKYIAIDPDYLTAVTTVYDKDGLSIAFTVSFGVISATDGKTADVSGTVGNTIGDIIVSEVGVKSGITFNSDNWDMLETTEYINNSAPLNFYFKGGTVRKLVDNVLKSDNAFLFTKNNGLLTLRQWGRLYDRHTIEKWEFMSWPKKDYKEAQKNFNSLALIQYELDIKNKTYGKQKASGTAPVLGRERKVEYKTDLTTVGDAIDLGNRMIKRFGILSETMQVKSGAPVIDINLLDTIEIDVTINGRAFSNKSLWIAREVDPGQDVLFLEAKSGFVEPDVIDGTLSYPGTETDSGVLSQPAINTVDGILNQQLTVIGE